jgi:hypothetical protein
MVIGEGEGKEMAFKDKDFNLPLEYEPLTQIWFLYLLPGHQFLDPGSQNLFMKCENSSVATGD